MPLRRRVKIGRRKQVERPEIIVIPMIDVMMFLLFFFMVASLAMVVQNALPVNLPKASTSNQQNVPPITITLEPDGSVYLNTAKVTMDQIEPGLKRLNAGPKTLVNLNADARVPMGTVVSAMNEARLAGVTAFGIATNK